MDKICPVCEGNKVIQESDSRGLRQYTCRTCKGKGTIPKDKIREEFEHRARNRGYDLIKTADGIYLDYNTSQLYNGYLMAIDDYKSRDEELEKWRDRNDKQEARIIDQDVEIKKLRDALSLTVRELKTCIVGYQRESLRKSQHAPNYDIRKSAIWEMFNFAINNAETVLRDGE